MPIIGKKFGILCILIFVMDDLILDENSLS